MHPQQQAFLKALQKNEDDACQLVYADWIPFAQGL